MLRAQITPLTLWQLDNTIFEGLTLPSRPFTNRGYEDLYLTGWDMDKTVLVNNLLMETAELSVLYTSPDFMKFAITEWSKKELNVWQSLYESLFFKYNPVWNKDGTKKHSETITRNLANGLTRSGTNGATVTESTSEHVTTDTDETIQRDEDSARTYTEDMAGDVTDTTTHNTNDFTENKVAAYDTATYQNRDTSDTDHTGTDTTVTDYDTTKTIGDNLVSHNDDTTRDMTEETTGTGSRTQTTSGTDSVTESGTDTGTITTINEDLEQGNIGVTTSPAMIAEFRELVKFNVFDYIIDSFKKRFCILLY